MSEIVKKGKVATLFFTQIPFLIDDRTFQITIRNSRHRDGDAGPAEGERGAAVAGRHHPTRPHRGHLRQLVVAQDEGNGDQGSQSQPHPRRGGVHREHLQVPHADAGGSGVHTRRQGSPHSPGPDADQRQPFEVEQSRFCF